MKNNHNIPIDRDRAFDINTLNELLTQGKAILAQAMAISQKMEASIAAIASIYSGIDGEYKVGALGSDIAALSGRLRRDIYQETISRMGRALKVQYPDGKEVSYAYGKSGERTAITYPDGKTASYTYDSQLRLSQLTDENGVIAYAYDEKGRLAQKTFPGGMQIHYAYNEEGRLSELIHRDREGILDRYTYRYDLTGNKTAIEKQRRGLPQESGTYAYTYDALGRLSTVTRNGETLRTYAYDAFGNRSLLKEGDRETAYAYNAMNQLTSWADAANEETYAYDNILQTQV